MTLSPTPLAAVLVAAVVSMGPAAPVAPTAEKPSVIVLILPGAGIRLGCYGAAVKTPHIDRLAKLGRRFDRAYGQYPAWEASRVSMMTGLRPESTGIVAPPKAEWLEEAIPLQVHFRVGGYLTARVGPIYGGEAEGVIPWDLVDAAPGAAARRAASLVEANRERLFFLAVGLPDVAGVAGGAPGLAKAEASADLPAIAVLPSRVDRPGRVTRLLPLAGEARRALLAAEDGRIAALDAQVGVILEAVDRWKLWDRLTVVLVSDHGAYLGEHGQALRKDLLFEETLRTTLIVSGAGVQAPGTATESFAELVDVYPTLVELGGLKKARGLQGTSLVPILRDPKAGVKTAAFSVAAREAGYIGRSVRTDRYRYNEWPDGSEELYDHEKDPNEWTNLAARGEGRGTIQEMKGLLDERERTAVPPPGQPASAARGGKKLNVLLIVLDDLTVHLGCYGYPVKTPNIDRLASLGRRFDRAYAQIPTCSPSRTSFMTGWRPERIELWNNTLPPRPKVQGSVPLQEHFHANGYFTARIGKIYHGPFEQDFRWDLAQYVPGAPRGPQGDEETRGSDRGDGEAGAEEEVTSWWLATDGPDANEPDGRRARGAARLLEERRSQPFFLAVGFAKPHLRWIAPRSYFDLYSPGALQVSAEPANDLDDVPAIALARNSPPAAPGLFALGRPPDLDETARRQALAAHYACVSFVDAQVGVVLEALDRLKLWDDTVVVLLGDHGFLLGEHGLWRKDTLFEADLRTPLIVVAPGVKSRGTPTRELAELLDVYPTLTDLTGLPRPAGVHGKSLVPLLENPLAPGRKEAFSFRRASAPRIGRTVRTERYRFTEWPDGSRELYDLTADPLETSNVARVATHATALAELKRLLDSGYRAAVTSRGPAAP